MRGFDSKLCNIIKADSVPGKIYKKDITMQGTEILRVYTYCIYHTCIKV